MASCLRMFSRGAVLADDATGALECASLLAGLGIDAALTLQNEPGGELPCGVLVVDTESRHLPAEEAGARIGRWSRHLAGQGIRRIFKKTDSTLRGNIASELMALPGSVVYVPAYPAMGRTVKEGRLFVHGVPLKQTEFERDARHRVRSSVIADLFPGHANIQICDAEAEDDLVHIAERLAPDQVVAGPAGFIKHWAALADFPAKPPEPRLPIRDWLIVCGSLHPQSRRQASIARASGLTVIATSEERERSAEDAAFELAERSAETIRQERPQGILIMGGDTAWALWRALGIEILTPLPEVLPGVAACRAGDLTIVTKAGGFGDDNLVSAVIEKFR